MLTFTTDVRSIVPTNFVQVSALIIIVVVVDKEDKKGVAHFSDKSATEITLTRWPIDVDAVEKCGRLFRK